jgi:hypothetical protein
MSEDRSALQRFEDLLARLFRVSKQELDEALESEKCEPIAEEEAAE